MGQPTRLLSLKRRLLIGSAFGLVVGWTTAVQAADPAASSTPAANAPATAVEEVVVTAQRRQERLVDVPASVTAVSATQLVNANVTSLAGLAQVTPGLRLDLNGPFTQPTIRGVSSPLAGTGIGANVATYVDGYYRPNQASNDYSFIDLDSVQVLKGPQGTLFGRSATGGAILITTRNPSLTSDDLELRESYGSYNDIELAGYGSYAFNDKLATSISAFYENNDGWYKNIITGNHDAKVVDVDVRNKWLFRPTDYASFTLTYEYADDRDPRGNVAQAYKGESDAIFSPGAIVALKPGTVSNNVPGLNDVLSNDIDFKAEFNLGWATLTSLTQYRTEDDHEALDLDGSQLSILAADFRYYQRLFTQEIDLRSSASGPLTWVAGLYYYHDNTYSPFSIAIGTPVESPFYTAYNNAVSYAGFADATYNVLKNLYLTVGGRVTEDIDYSGFNFPVGAPLVAVSHSWDSFTPRATIRYEFSPQSNVYASFSQGNRPGTFNTAGFATTPVNPEKVTAWEVGYKAVTGPVRFETAAYYYKYSNQQVSAYEGPVSVLLNAAASRIYGAEAHVNWAVTHDFSLDVGGEYTNAKYTDFPNAPHYVWSPTTGVSVFPDDASGFTSQRAPRVQLDATANYAHPLFQGMMNLSANASYQSKTYFDFFDSTYQNGYAILNLRASWTDPSGKFSAAVYGRNVTDTRYFEAVEQNSLFFPARYGDPATVGVELQQKF